MHAGAPHVIIDRRICWKAPHRLQRLVPLQFIRLRIPRVTTQSHQIESGLEPRLAFAHPLFHTHSLGDVIADTDHAPGITFFWAPSEECPSHLAIGSKDALLQYNVRPISEGILGLFDAHANFLWHHSGPINFVWQRLVLWREDEQCLRSGGALKEAFHGLTFPGTHLPRFKGQS